MEQARGRTGAGNGGKTGRKTVRGKDPEAVAREQFAHAFALERLENEC